MKKSRPSHKICIFHDQRERARTRNLTNFGRLSAFVRATAQKVATENSSFPQPARREIYFKLNNAERKESPHCESEAKHFWHPRSMSLVHYRHFAEFSFTPTVSCQRKQPANTGQQSLLCDLQVGLFVLMRAAFT